MPLYEFICSDCHSNHEVLQKISDPPLIICPNCQGHTLKKSITAASFRLKGQGWYETDFKDNNKKNILQQDSIPSINSTTTDSQALKPDVDVSLCKNKNLQKKTEPQKKINSSNKNQEINL